MAKLTPPCFSMKLHGMNLPDASIVVSTPTVVPTGAFWATVKLLIAIVMTSPVWQRADTAASLSTGNSHQRFVYGFGCALIANKRGNIKHYVAVAALLTAVGTSSWTYLRSRALSRRAAAYRRIALSARLWSTLAHLGRPLPPYHSHGEDTPAKWQGEALRCRPIRGSSSPSNPPPPRHDSSVPGRSGVSGAATSSTAAAISAGFAIGGEE